MQRVNAVAAAVCVAILFVIESPAQDVSTLQPQEISRAQLDHTPSPTPLPDDPVSTSSIDLVMGSPVQDTSKVRAEAAPNPHDAAVSTSSIDLVMGSPVQDTSKVQAEVAPNSHDDAVRASSIDLVMGSPVQDTSMVQLVKPSNARREAGPSPVAIPDDPVSTASIGRLSGTAGRPLCVRRDALAAMLIESAFGFNQAQATTMGCQTIPEDAEVELLQQLPSGFQFLRIVKVKVTSHTQPEPLVGYTIDIGR